jgi:hypothetical protein
MTRREGNSALEIDVKPATILTPITRFDWPTSLDLKFEICSEAGATVPAAPVPSVMSPLTGMKRIYANIMEHAFVAYFERYKDEIKAAITAAGPGSATLAFARTLRNAFAHGGVIHITRPGVTVAWGGLSYSDRENGRQVMYQDMSQGDVILLMLEMEKLF